MYATLANLLALVPERELVELTDDEGTGAINQGRIDAALTAAGVTIDGYVAAKYRTGSQPVPPLLAQIACDIARFKLYRQSAPPERVEKDHDRALATLRDIARGTIKLDQGEETVPERDGAILVERPARIFGRDSMGGF